ncbi:MAG TPA: hypothetical protein VMU02_07425 [bacterium]|nr:hypothetical protein [bacterium]
MIASLGVWVAAILTLAIFSFLYKDNPFFKFAEHLLVGVSAGYYLIQYFFSAAYKKLVVPVFVDHRILLVVGGILGIMMFTRLSRKFEWISRYPVAFYVAAWAGYVIPSYIQVRILQQAESTMFNPTAVPLKEAVSLSVLFIGVVTTLIYFYFSAEHRGTLKGISRVGITFLMIGFGATFGYNVMGRVSLLIGRFQFIFGDWLKLIH